MAAMTNAQRQKLWRERRKTGDLFPPVGSVTPVTPFDQARAVTLGCVDPVTPGTETPQPVTSVRFHRYRDAKFQVVDVDFLALCPFCGGGFYGEPPHAEETHQGSVVVCCVICGAQSGPSGDLAGALRAWNRRLS